MNFSRYYWGWFFEPTVDEEWITLRDMGILDPRILDDYEIDILNYRAKSAVTIGMEIEQNPGATVYNFEDNVFNEIIQKKTENVFSILSESRDVRKFDLEVVLVGRWGPPRGHHSCDGRWMYDGSGPVEWSYGIGKTGIKVLKMFLNDWLYHSPQHYVWEWHAQYGGRGCGSHLHIRPSYDNLTNPNDPVQIGELWAVTWNTAVTLLPFMIPFFVWEMKARYEASRWAKPYYVRYSPRTIYQKVQQLDGHEGRDNYKIISLTGITRCPKPLTIEIRIAENHPTITLAGAQILNRIIGGAIKRNFVSPKVTPETEIKLIEIEDMIVHAGIVYDELENIGPIEFLPGRGIPGVKKLRFKNAWEVTKAICDILLRHGKKVWGRWTVRVAKLISEKGVPAANSWAVWRILEPDFSWEDPEIDMSVR